MPDNTQISLAIGFELLLVFGTLYSIAWRQSLFGGRGRRELPMSPRGLLLVVAAVGAAMVLIGGMSPVVAISLALSVVAAWVAIRRFAPLPGEAAGPIGQLAPSTPSQREPRIRAVKIVVIAYLISAAIVGGGGYWMYMYMGMPPATARAIIGAILVLLALWMFGLCWSILQGRR